MFYKKTSKILQVSKYLPDGKAILSIFDFDLEYIKGSQNSIPDFLTREFLQGKK